MYRQNVHPSFALELGGCEPPHPPGVPVLVADLLLHLGVRQSLQERRPRVGIALRREAVIQWCREIDLKCNLL